MPILEWKWEKITIGFMVGLPKTLRKYKSIWAIVDQLTKLAQFVKVRVDYNRAKFFKI